MKNVLINAQDNTHEPTGSSTLVNNQCHIHVVHNLGTHFTCRAQQYTCMYVAHIQRFNATHGTLLIFYMSAVLTEVYSWRSYNTYQSLAFENTLVPTSQ